MKTYGFSLIELMVVIGIVGILAAVAVSSYKQYQISTIVAKTFTVVDMFKEQIILTYDLKSGTIPLASAFLPAATATYNAWLIGNGTDTGGTIINLALSTQYSIGYLFYNKLTNTSFELSVKIDGSGYSQIDGTIYTFYATDQNGTFIFTCSSNTTPVQYLPPACQ